MIFIKQIYLTLLTRVRADTVFPRTITFQGNATFYS